MIRDIDGLIRARWADEADRTGLQAVGERYAIAIPPALAALIDDSGDPIGRQFVPHSDERLLAPHESPDPIGDDALSPLPGIVHRYADRVLLKPLLICPVYCRFCFRREHVGPDGGLLTEAQLDAAYAWIAERPAIREVILTGGDPLMLSPRRLRAIHGGALGNPSCRDHPPAFAPACGAARAADGMPWPRRWRATERSGSSSMPTTRGSFSETARLALRRVQRQGIPAARPIGAAARRQRHGRRAGSPAPRHDRGDPV